MKQIAVTKAVKPVFPPAATPDEDSTKVVTVEVPPMEPTQVAIASASMDLFMFKGVPFSSKRLPLEQAPYKVPIVSNISIMQRESAEVMRTITRLPVVLPLPR